MSARFAAAAAALGVMTLVLAGCQPVQVGSDPSNPDQLEVLTGWTSGTDRAGLLALFDEFERQHPDIAIIDSSVKGGAGSAARAALEQRLEAGNPPDTFLTSAGASLSDYVGAGQIRDLSGVLSPKDLAAYPPALLSLLTIDGALYAAPASVNRENLVWTNNVVLRSAGLDPADPPQTIDGWLADLQTMRSAGVEFPLAIGRDWTQVLLFESVLIAELGGEDYREWLRLSTGTPSFSTSQTQPTEPVQDLPRLSGSLKATRRTS
jgi:glucose/mannose transport system substrate-binding protein